MWLVVYWYAQHTLVLLCLVGLFCFSLHIGLAILDPRLRGDDSGYLVCHNAVEEYVLHARVSAAAATAMRMITVSISKPFMTMRDINVIVRAILPNVRSHLFLLLPIIRPIAYVDQFSTTATMNNSIRAVRSAGSMLGCRQHNDMR